MCLTVSSGRAAWHWQESSSIMTREYYTFNLNAYCEEGVSSLLEVRASLTIVHKDLTLIDDRHLSEALLGVKQDVEDCSHADDYERSNNKVVLHHSVVLLL